MALLDLVRRYKRFDFAGFVPVTAVADGRRQRIGWTKTELAKALAGFGYVFRFDDETLHLNPELLTYEARTEAVDAILTQASNEGYLPVPPDFSAFGGIDWFPVGPNIQPLFQMQRFYTTYLGIKRYGSRINGYHNGQMWIVKRGDVVHEYPGYWDTLVGAGQIAGRSIRDHVIVEAHEEAGLTEPDCRTMISTGMFHVCSATSKGFLLDENIYVYDLPMPGITPRVMHNWETAAIELWPYEKVMQKLYYTEEFRPEAALCLIDFFIRHGHITPDNEPDFDALCQGLRENVPTP